MVYPPCTNVEPSARRSLKHLSVAFNMDCADTDMISQLDPGEDFSWIDVILAGGPIEGAKWPPTLQHTVVYSGGLQQKRLWSQVEQEKYMRSVSFLWSNLLTILTIQSSLRTMFLQ